MVRIIHSRVHAPAPLGAQKHTGFFSIWWGGKAKISSSVDWSPTRLKFLCCQEWWGNSDPGCGGSQKPMWEGRWYRVFSLKGWRNLYILEVLTKNRIKPFKPFVPQWHFWGAMNSHWVKIKPFSIHCRKKKILFWTINSRISQPAWGSGSCH